MTFQPITRRQYLATLTTGLAAATAALAAPQSARAAAKTSKAAAGYVSHTTSPAMHCANCANYLAGNSTCTIVAGPVAPDGYCNFYTPTG